MYHKSLETVNDIREVVQSLVDDEAEKFKLDKPPSSTSTDSAEFSADQLRDIVLKDSEFISVDLPDRKTFLHPFLREQSLILLTAPRGTGKTFFGMSLADAITKELDFGPWKVLESANVLYVDAEMAFTDVKERLRSLGVAGCKSEFFVYCDHLAWSRGLPKADLLNDSWQTSLSKILQDKAIQILILDNLGSLAPYSDENSKRDFDPVNQFLLKLRFTGITTILVHHTGKSGEQRGTSAKEDNVDISITLKQPPGYVPTDGCRFIAHFSKARIPTCELPLIGDTEFKLLETIGDGIQWTWKSASKSLKAEIIRMFDQGLRAKDIAEVLTITKGRVSQLKAEALKEGLLSRDLKLTAMGYCFLDGS